MNSVTLKHKLKFCEYKKDLWPPRRTDEDFIENPQILVDGNNIYQSLKCILENNG